MIEKYKHTDNNLRGYSGYSFDKQVIISIFRNDVKNILLDKPQKTEYLETLRTLQNDTGFKASEMLLADIQILENETVDVQNFRIGEALAEVVLTKDFQCRFYWNELRDMRNIKGNKTGADLVGFIEVEGNILFLFGEIKTSSEQQSPPQVMTNPTGIEKQLKNLYSQKEKRLILIRYLQSKLELTENNFRSDFNKAIHNYYKEDGQYMLYGILVRDTEPNENDLKKSYAKLKEEILSPIGLKLLALYMPIPKDKWLSIINGGYYDSN